MKDIAMLRAKLDMDRRDLAKSAVLGAAMAVALPLAGNAQTPDPDENVVFTEGDPGHWADKVALHVPLVTVVGNTLTVKTPHSMSEAHYIVSHTVVLAGGVFLSRKTFTHMDTPVSEHILPPGYKGKVTCTSTCNQHDFWVKSISV
jgi:superoxide reductase